MAVEATAFPNYDVAQDGGQDAGAAVAEYDVPQDAVVARAVTDVVY